MALSRDQLLGGNLARVEVPIPERGGSVYVRELTAKEMDAYQVSVMDGKPGVKGTAFRLEGARVRLAVLCTVDEDGNRIFEDGDESKLEQQGNAFVQRLFDAAGKINRLTEKDVEELVKNSESTPSA